MFDVCRWGQPSDVGGDDYIATDLSWWDEMGPTDQLHHMFHPRRLRNEVELGFMIVKWIKGIEFA